MYKMMVTLVIQRHSHYAPDTIYSHGCRRTLFGSAFAALCFYEPDIRVHLYHPFFLDEECV